MLQPCFILSGGLNMQVEIALQGQITIFVIIKNIERRKQEKLVF